MSLTYFRRYRMECDLRQSLVEMPPCPVGYHLVPHRDTLNRSHAAAKFESFRHEIDANVFPCLGRQDGCLRLMKEITSRAAFVPQATWLIRYAGDDVAVGTIQGLSMDSWGSIQNIGVVPAHRGRGLGALLLSRAAAGFREIGVRRMHLEVTTQNVAAVRLYDRLGFRPAQVVYKAVEV